eukprot:GHVS01001152.1.p1 GENE.GHVS01001152.1~~GHVS01001152.1.p1  ORF type:complete len:576 (+),score=61.77 GHVS01001152.1:199-1926(+)
MASTLLSIGGVLVLPWIGVFVCLLQLQPAVAVAWKPYHPNILPFLDEFIGCFANEGKDVSHPYQFYFIPKNDVDLGNGIENVAFLLQRKKEGPTTPESEEDREGVIEVEGNAAKLFHALAQEVDDLESTDSGERDVMSWKQASRVARKGMEKNILMPIGVIECDDRLAFVTLLFGPVNDCFWRTDEPESKWSADQLTLLAQSLYTSSEFLRDHEVKHSLTLSHHVVGKNDKTKFLVSLFQVWSIGDIKPQRSWSPITGDFRANNNSQNDLYSIGELLTNLRGSEGGRELVHKCHTFVRSAHSATHLALKQGNLPDIFKISNAISNSGLDLQETVGQFEVDVQRESQRAAFWIEKAFIHPPYLAPPTQTLEDNDDQQRRLNIFCLLASVDFPANQPTLKEAFKYLQAEGDIDEMLKVDVSKHLLPHSIRIVDILEIRPNAKQLILEKLLVVSKALLAIDPDNLKKDMGFAPTVGNPGGKFCIMVNEYQGRVRKLMDQSLKFTDIIKKASDSSLRRALTVIHTFEVLFPGLSRYIDHSGWKTAGVDGFTTEGKLAYNSITNKDVFGEWRQLLEALAV